MAGKKRTHQGIALPVGVRVRGNRLQISFSWQGEQQQINIPFEPTEKNIAYAGGLVQTIRREIELDRFSWQKHFPDHPYAKGTTIALPTDSLVGHLLDDYLQESASELAGVTWDNYCYAVNNFLKPEFGHLSVADLEAGHVRQWVKRNNHLTRTTLNGYLAPMRSALREAVLDGKIEKNVLDRFVWPKESKKVQESKRQKEEEGEVDPFNREEITAILNACQHRPQEQNMIRFGFWTGVRLEELFAVQWGDVDWIGNTIRIQRALVKRKGYKTNGVRMTNITEIKGLKTSGKGVRRRDLVLMPEAIKALTAQKPHTFLMGEWIFHNPHSNTHWQGTNQFYNRWRALLVKAGVRHRRPYQIRHTWASMLLAAGEDEAFVSRMLGHVNTEMVRKIYRRFIPNGEGSGYRFRNDWGNQSEGQEGQK